MPLFKDLSPVDQAGLADHRPEREVQWTRLENMIFRDGGLAKRPGLLFPSWRLQGPLRDNEYPAVSRGYPVAIMEINNPGSDNVGREGWKWITESEAPTSNVEIVAGWTGDYTDIDDDPPNGTDYMESSTDGAQEAIGFSNLSKDFDAISHIILRGRARTYGRAVSQTLGLHFRYYGTNYSLGSLIIYPFADGGESPVPSPDWESFALVAPLNPRTGSSDQRWLKGTINDANTYFVVESLIGDEPLTEWLFPTGDGASTDGTDWTNGGTATYEDYDLNGITWWFTQWVAGLRRAIERDTGEEFSNGCTLSSANDAQSFTVSASESTFNTISSILISCYLLRTGVKPHSLIEMFFRPVSGSSANEQVIQTLRSGVAVEDGTLADTLDVAGYYSFAGYATTNPYTSAAWTMADITAGEFGVRLLDGAEITIGTATFKVEGLATAASSGIYLDNLRLDVVGTDADEALDLGIVGKTRLWSTDKAHLRLTAPSDIDDVTNSVAVTTPGTLPLDWAILYGQVYLANGTDKTRRYPNSSDVWEELTNNGSNYITGRTVAAFADRILYGWVNDNGDVTPERIAYSKIYDGGDHDDDSAGDFDLLDTPGGVIKLAPLSEDICAAYKEVGVYSLRRTGNDAAPIVRDLIDAQTGCVAMATVQTLVDMNGRPFQLFLGENPSNGLNVYAFDGSTVSPVWGIHKALREDSNKESILRAFAGVEPQEGHYNLFVAMDDDCVPEHYFTYHVRSGQWSGPHSLSYPVTCAGQWSMDLDYEFSVSGTIRGTKYLVLGTTDGLIRYMDYNATFDEYFPPGTAADRTDSRTYSPQALTTFGHQGMFANTFDGVVETGDFRLVDEGNPELQATAYRVHLMYKDTGPTRVKVSVSVDGGVSYNEERPYLLGGADPDDWGQYLYEVLDVVPATGRRHRVQLKFDAEIPSERSDVKEIWLEYEPTAENP